LGALVVTSAVFGCSGGGSDDGVGSQSDPAKADEEQAGTVVCGDAPCEDAEICCLHGAGQFPNLTYTLTCTDSCPGTDPEVECDGPEDCGAGEVCCMNPEGVFCTDDCSGMAAAACHDDTDCSDASCIESSLSPLGTMCL
jgi:hypothetical protein